MTDGRHPDKNMDRVEFATAKFQLIQCAYERLKEAFETGDYEDSEDDDEYQDDEYGDPQGYYEVTHANHDLSGCFVPITSSSK